MAVTQKPISGWTEVTDWAAADNFPITIDVATTPKSRRISGTNFFAKIKAPIVVTSTSPQLKLAYDGSNHLQVAVGSAGAVVVTPTGASTGIAILSAGANALTVGRQGATAPAFHVDASAATSATGIKITAAASSGGVTIAALGGAAETLKIDAKGTGNLLLQTVATGSVIIGTSATTTAKLMVRGLAYPIVTIVNASAATTTIASGLRMGAVSTGDMADGFGTGIVYTVTDDAAVDNAIGRLSCVRDGADTSGTWIFAVNSALTEAVRISTAGNVGIGQSTFGTSATKTLAVSTGTAPSTSPADAFQVYSADAAGAGTAAPHFRTEAGKIIKLYQQAHIADAAGGTEIATINAILVALENAGFLATS